MKNLSGRLTKVRGFRGTICDIKEKEYLLNKINNLQSIAHHPNQIKPFFYIIKI